MIIQAIIHQIKSARSEVILPSELTFFNDNEEWGRSVSSFSIFYLRTFFWPCPVIPELGSAKLASPSPAGLMLGSASRGRWERLPGWKKGSFFSSKVVLFLLWGDRCGAGGSWKSFPAEGSGSFHSSAAAGDLHLLSPSIQLPIAHSYHSHTLSSGKNFGLVRGSFFKKSFPFLHFVKS